MKKRQVSIRYSVDVGSNSDKIAAMLSGQVDLMPGAYIKLGKDYLTAGQFACIGAPTEEDMILLLISRPFKGAGDSMAYPDCDFSFDFPG